MIVQFHFSVSIHLSTDIRVSNPECFGMCNYEIAVSIHLSTDIRVSKKNQIAISWQVEMFQSIFPRTYELVMTLPKKASRIVSGVSIHLSTDIRVSNIPLVFFDNDDVFQSIFPRTYELVSLLADHTLIFTKVSIHLSTDIRVSNDSTEYEKFSYSRFNPSFHGHTS